MRATPELKQIHTLKRSDFEREPLWLGVHNADFGKPWYDESDEETYRPWTGELPAPAGAGIVLVKADLLLAQGSRFDGFFRAVTEDWDAPVSRKTRDGAIVWMRTFSQRHAGSALVLLGLQQPRIFVGDDQVFSFWGGRRGISDERRQEFYAAVGRKAADIFPITFGCEPGLVTGIAQGNVDGFYRTVRDAPPAIEL